MLLFGLMYLCTAKIGQTMPQQSILQQLQQQGHQFGAQKRIISERTKRGLFSSLVGLANSGMPLGNKEPDDDASVLKPKPYDFNEVEMTAIQAMVSLRDIIGDLLQRVGLNMPSLASLITRSEHGNEKVSPGFTESSNGGALSHLTSNKGTNMGIQLLRGLALSLPLLIPMATQIRRMSPDTSSAAATAAATMAQPLILPQMPIMLPDLYYNQAMHRRRGKRSTRVRRSISTLQRDPIVMAEHLFNGRAPFVRYLRQMEAKYAANNK